MQSYDTSQCVVFDSRLSLRVEFSLSLKRIIDATIPLSHTPNVHGPAGTPKAHRDTSLSKRDLMFHFCKEINNRMTNVCLYLSTVSYDILRRA